MFRLIKTKSDPKNQDNNRYSVFSMYEVLHDLTYSQASAYNAGASTPTSIDNSGSKPNPQAVALLEVWDRMIASNLKALADAVAGYSPSEPPAPPASGPVVYDFTGTATPRAES
jgi:hypothetical protein